MMYHLLKVLRYLFFLFHYLHNKNNEVVHHTHHINPKYNSHCYILCLITFPAQRCPVLRRS